MKLGKNAPAKLNFEVHVRMDLKTYKNKVQDETTQEDYPTFVKKNTQQM